LAHAIREGRAVDDVRDAPLAVAWARRLQAGSWPRWVLPRTRPRGRSAVLWSLHAAWAVILIVAVIVVPLWRSGGVPRWLVVGGLAYSALGIPLIALTLRMRWNAPAAERRNRELLSTAGAELSGPS
jgi:hypothetical protein